VSYVCKEGNEHVFSECSLAGRVCVCHCVWLAFKTRDGALPLNSERRGLEKKKCVPVIEESNC
jgi:hypothetical protein